MGYPHSEAADVTITVYDVQGELVRALDLGHQSAGAHRARDAAAHWDGRDDSGETVVSGVYFIEMSAGEYRKVRRIVLLK